MTDNHASPWEQAVQWLLEQPDKSELVRESYFDSPLLAAAQRYWGSGEWNEIRNWLPRSGGKALDVGSGRGIAAFALAKEGFAVTALEPDPSALVGADAIRSLAAAARLNISVIQEFSERLPFPDCEFDVLFARAVLHHTSNLEAACREMFRVLKPRGRFVAVREHVISRPGDLELFLGLHPLHGRYGGENAYLLKYYVSAITQAGFRLDRVIRPLESAINFAPFTLATLKREIAARSARVIPGSGRVVEFLLGVPGMWPLIRPLCGWFDHRPGRLYSFVAAKP